MYLHSTDVVVLTILFDLLSKKAALMVVNTPKPSGQWGCDSKTAVEHQSGNVQLVTSIRLTLLGAFRIKKSNEYANPNLINIK